MENIQSSTNSDRIIGHSYTYSSQHVQNLIQNDHIPKCKTVKISEENLGENLYNPEIHLLISPCLTIRKQKITEVK